MCPGLGLGQFVPVMIDVVSTGIAIFEVLEVLLRVVVRRAHLLPSLAAHLLLRLLLPGVCLLLGRSRPHGRGLRAALCLLCPRLLHRALIG